MKRGLSKFIPHAREGVEYQPNQGAIAQAGKGLVGREHRRLAPSLRVLRSPDRVRGIHGHHLRDYHPVKKHAQRSQALLHRGPLMQCQLGLDKGRHMHRLDLAEIHDAVLSAEG